jgi:HEPN domain-containing protein
MAENAEWLFEQASISLHDAETLADAGGGAAQILFLTHRAQELALKGALAAEGRWPDDPGRLKTHDLGKLAEELASSGVTVPKGVATDIEETRAVPRVGDGPCESSVMVRYSANLEWGAIDVRARLDAAATVVEYFTRVYASRLQAPREPS